MGIFLLIVIIVIGVSVYNSHREKQERLESQIQREREEKERRETEEAKKKIETEKAKRIVETENFKKLYNYINNENLKFKEKGNSSGVYECYPYNSFSIIESGIVSMYYILTFSPFKIDFKLSSINFRDIGIPNIKSDEIGAFSCAFGLKPGYVYDPRMEKVLIDKGYWNASKSVSDIEKIYNVDK